MSDTSPLPPPPPFQPPPGYAGYEDNYAAGVRDLRSVGGLAKWVCGLTLLAAVAQFIGTALSYTVREDARDFQDGALSEDEFLDAFNSVAAVSTLALVPFIAAIVTTLIWSTRIAGNHRALGRNTRWSPGMAAGGWFLPPVLFVIPMLFTHEAWKASDPSVPPGEQRWTQRAANPMVFVWWVLYGIVPLAFIPFTLGRMTSFNPSGEDLATQLIDDLGFQLAASGVQVLAGIAWAVVVFQITTQHRQFTGEARR
ncbi:MAG: DUF4328 domain-containing protein [Actinomycetota bacterium]|nr:DUF4328 domain-containing protein [Actinomycetota bacterium]